MTRKSTGRPESRNKEVWLDAEALKAVPVRQVLEEYGLLENLNERGLAMNGPSPFSDGGVLSLNLEKNVWNDSWGRPQIEGRPVPGNVIGLVQAIEGVTFRRALEILHERFSGELKTETRSVRDSEACARAKASAACARAKASAACARAKASAALRRESMEAKHEGNTPFGQELKGLKADVPFLREAGISPELAKSWGVGWCSRGLLRGRIAFPIRSPDGTVMAYTGLSPKVDEPEGRWKFPSGFQRGLELFGIDQVHQDEALKQQARELGLILAEDPLEVLRLQIDGPRAVVSPMGAELSEAQLAMLLDPAINPSGRLTLADRGPRRAWAAALIRRAWVRYAEPSDKETDA